MSLTRINTNVEAMFAHTAILQTERAMDQSMKRISTGKRINSSADDPSGVKILSNFRAQLSGTTVAVQNTQESLSMMNTADTSMNQIMDNLISCRDLALRAANSATMDTGTLSALNSQYQALRNAVYSLKNTTFNGVNLLDETATTGLAATGGLNIQCGPDSNAGNSMNIKLANGINGTQVGGQAWSQATINANTTAAQTAVTQIDNVMDAWSSQMASLGGQMDVVQIKLAGLQSNEVNLTSVVSTVGDADIAAEISEYTRLQIVSNAAISMLAQANTQSASLMQKLLA